MLPLKPHLESKISSQPSNVGKLLAEGLTLGHNTEKKYLHLSGKVPNTEEKRYQAICSSIPQSAESAGKNSPCCGQCS